MDWIVNVDTKLDEFHLLKHPFYQAWNSGSLSLDDLKHYAKQYYHHVKAFPQYVSAIHSLAPDRNSREILLENLIDEERGSEHHPELWLRFAEGLGLSREEVENAQLNDDTKRLLNGYREICHTSYEDGLAALYAYERQVSVVSESKIEGLNEHYGITDERAIKFFRVHITADQWHSDECRALLAKLDVDDNIKKLIYYPRAASTAVTAARLLWGFLDGVWAKCSAYSADTGDCNDAGCHTCIGEA